MRRLRLTAVVALVAAVASFGASIGPETGSIRAGGFGDSMSGQLGAETPMFASRDTMRSGVSFLPEAITVNGTTVAPKLRYDAANISGTDWTATVGETLSEADTGTSPTSGRPAPFTDATESVLYPNGKVHEGSATAADDITTGDHCLEAVVKTANATGAQAILGTKGPTGAGWSLRYSSQRFEVEIDDGTTNSVTHATYQYYSTWHHILWCANRDEASTDGSGLYVNGELKGSTDISAVSDTLASASDLVVGARADYSQQFLYGEVAYFAVWEQADLFSSGSTGKTEMGDLAVERFNRLIGIEPQYALGDPVPLVQSRATEKFCRIYDGTDTVNLFQVGNHWLCLDAHGATWPVASGAQTRGLSLEASTTNLLTYNEEFDQWTATNSTIDADAVDSPYRETNADGIVGDGTDAAHYVTMATTLTATTYAISVFAKAGDQDFVVVSDDTLGDGSYFDLTDCSSGSDFGTAPNTKFAEDFGSGWCRVGITVTGTAASHTIGLYAATADADNTFAGDSSTVNTYLWGGQVEPDVYMSSVVLTTAANNARSSDDLRFDSTDNAYADGDGALKATYMCASYAPGASKQLVDVSNGSINERFHIHINSADVPYSFGTTASSIQWSIAGTTDPTDGASHVHRSSMQSNNVELFFDGASEGTPDTTATVSTTHDRIAIGYLLAAGTDLPSHCIIQNFSIWDSPGGGA